MKEFLALGRRSPKPNVTVSGDDIALLQYTGGTTGLSKGAIGLHRNLVPHAPSQPVDARVVSIYGDGLSAGQYHVVSINRGRRDGIEPGHVLALLRAGERVVDREDPLRPTLKLPDEPHGQLFVFRVFERVSYGLILSAQTAVRPGDRCTPP